jgi:Protein of unknown function (DUF2971)
MVLHHYTTAAGLKGIIKSKSVWASDYRFLNDAREIHHGLDIFEQRFESSTTRTSAPDIRDSIKQLRSATKNFSVFIAAFSKQPDLLSQWRGYNGARGYSIGINDDWLNQNAEAQEFRLIPVEYDIAKQQHVVNKKLLLLETMLDTRAATETVFETVSKWWKQQLLYTIAALKNEHFKEEEEVRLVWAGDGWPNGTRTREAARGLVPYVPVKLNAKIINHPKFHPNNVGFERIIIGPALSEQQKFAVDALLASEHMRFTIDKSTIPFVTD